MILGLAVLVEHQLVADGWTHDDSKYRISVSSRQSLIFAWRGLIIVASC